MFSPARVALVLALWTAGSCGYDLRGAQLVDHPFPGITSITRTEDTPRNVSMHIVTVDLTEPGIGFKLTPPGGRMETVR